MTNSSHLEAEGLFREGYDGTRVDFLGARADTAPLT